MDEIKKLLEKAIFGDANASLAAQRAIRESERAFEPTHYLEAMLRIARKNVGDKVRDPFYRETMLRRLEGLAVLPGNGTKRPRARDPPPVQVPARGRRAFLQG